MVTAVTFMQSRSPAYSIAKTESDSTRMSAGRQELGLWAQYGTDAQFVSPTRCAHWARAACVRLCRIFWPTITDKMRALSQSCLCSVVSNILANEVAVGVHEMVA